MQSKTRELNAAILKSEAASYAKSKFLASMSHELRTPLNSVIGFSGRLINNTSEPLTDKQKQYLKLISDAGQNMLSLVNQVLSFSEVSIDNQDIVMEPICIESVVSQCLTLVTPMANRRRITIDHQEPPTSNIAVLGNTEYVKEILLVFLSNATTYIQEEGDVSISYQIKDQDLLRITVSDNGPGIPKDKQSNIFEPFDRLDNASGHISGAGIGLPIAKLMAAVMNGQIGYSENTPNGASFWLDMPLQS